MMARAHRKYLLRKRLRGTGLLAGSVASVIASMALSFQDRLAIAVIVTAIAACLAGLAQLLSRPKPFAVLLDRPLANRNSAPDARLSWTLTMNMHELDVIARQEGVVPLSSFLELEATRGCARHDPRIALTSVETLLRVLESNEAVDSPLDREALARSLRQLGRQLEAGQSLDASFCLWPTSAWTGAMEANLGLYLT